MISEPAANFLDITLAAIRGIDSTVAVTSRSAYIFLSAGTKLAVCPIKDIPIVFKLLINCTKPGDRL